MIPFAFLESNRRLYPPKEAPESAGEITPLDIWTDSNQCVSCWKMSLRERLSALIFGRVWVSVLSGSSQPPIQLQATYTVFKHVPIPEDLEGI